MKKHGFFAFLTALALTVTLSAPVPAAAEDLTAEEASALLVPVRQTYTGQFADISGAWCEAAVGTCYQTGLLAGKTADRFDAVGKLTCAQITVISARLLAYLNGGDGIFPAPAEGEAWYQPYAAYLSTLSDSEAVLVFLRDLELYPGQPDTPCTRGSFVRMLSGILPPDALRAVNSVSCVIDSADADVLAFYRAGILSGTDAYGTFGGEDPLTRGAAAAMLARVVDPEQRLTFTLKDFDLCRDILGVEPDAALLTVEGETISAELFAQQLCKSLCQWKGDAQRALEDAIHIWCWYDAPYQVLAAETGVALSEEKQAQLSDKARARGGMYGLSAAYWQRYLENISLNLALAQRYSDLDWKQGERLYHDALEVRSNALEQSAAPTETLRALDLTDAYAKLKTTAFAAWAL